MELWDIYDIDRQKSGRTIQRGEKLTQGQLHLVVHIGIFNSKNQLLIQQRQPWKEGYPNLWDISAAGSALAGETSQQAAARELKEELGLEHDFSGERPFFTVNFSVGFDDYYMVQQDAELSSLHLQQAEVKDAKWADLTEIERMIDCGEFIPYYREIVRLWFLMKDRRGSTVQG